MIAATFPESWRHLRYEDAGLDGQHFYRALAEAGSGHPSKFLFATGDVLSVSTQEFLRRHRLPRIAKPFRLEEFADKLAQDEQIVAVESENQRAAGVVQNVGRIAEIGKHVRDELRDGRFVFDDQHPA